MEKRIARFLGTEDAIVFVSGYLTNVTVISHLLSKSDAAIYDSAAHNSILNGARLSGARMITFANGDWEGLDQAMMANRAEFRRGLLIGEGVYSMDGNVLDLERAVEMKRRHDLLLMVDEAHSLGTIYLVLRRPLPAEDTFVFFPQGQIVRIAVITPAFAMIVYESDKFVVFLTGNLILKTPSRFVFILAVAAVFVFKRHVKRPPLHL